MVTLDYVFALLLIGCLYLTMHMHWPRGHFP